MKTKGFTLVELIGVIVVIALIALVVIPPINNMIRENNKNMYDQTITQIELSANNWGVDNIYLLPLTETDVFYITLGQLKYNGYVDVNVKNPLTNECFDDDMLIEITKVEKTYKYNVLEDTGSRGCNTSETNVPVLVLKGGASIDVEINTSFNDPGVVAYDFETSSSISSTTSFTYNGSSVTSIDTKKLGTYVITYSAYDNGAESTITREVNIVDTTSPVLTVNNQTISHTTNVELNNFVEYAYTVSDNSQFTGSLYQDNLDVVITNEVDDSKEGSYYITYTATDHSGNEKVIKVRVTVVDTIAPTLTLDTTSINIFKGTDYNLSNNITADMIDVGTGIKDLKFYYNDEIIENLNTLEIGSYTIKAIATDNSINKNQAIVNINVTIN